MRYTVGMNDWNMMQGTGYNLPFSPGWLIVLLVWTLVWKGLALWHSAKRGDSLWFVVLLVVNTIGILDILYLFLVAKKRMKDLFPMK